MGVASGRCYAAILACWITNVANAFTMGFPATALPDIQTGRYGFVFASASLSAWYVSCNPIVSVFGSVVVTRLVDAYGRKLGLMLMISLNTIGWLCTTSANGVGIMFIGRIILSLNDVALQTTLTIVVAELTPKEIRGKAIFGVITGFLVGLSLSYVFGAFLIWRWLAVVAMGFHLFALLCFCLLIPETPRWLIMHGDREFAKLNLGKMRNHHPSNREEKLHEEISEMEQSLGIMETESPLQVLKRLFKPPLLRPFVLVNLAIMFQQLTATAYIKSFMVKLFQLSSGHGAVSTNPLLANPHYQTIVVGFSGVLGGLLSIPSSDFFGRRPCFITSGSVLTLSLSSLAAYYWTFHYNPQWAVECIGWLPLAGLMCFNVGYAIGYCQVTGTLGNEMLPTCVRATAMAFFGLNHSIFYFIVVQLFGGLDVEPRIMFTTYASIAVIGVSYFVFFIPETKNKSLESIEKIWIGNMTKSDNLHISLNKN